MVCTLHIGSTRVRVRRAWAGVRARVVCRPWQRRRASVSEVGTILEQWRESGVKWVRFELPDMHGNSRSKTIPIQHAGSYAETGLNMYGGAAVLDTRSDVVGGTLYNEERGYGDQLLFPDPDTAALVPWADHTARLICDPSWQDGSAP